MKRRILETRTDSRQAWLEMKRLMWLVAGGYFAMASIDGSPTASFIALACGYFAGMARQTRAGGETNGVQVNADGGAQS